TPFQPGAAKVRERAEGRRPEIDSWFYAPTWQRVPLAIASVPQAPKTHETWLVLGEAQPLVDRVIRRLEGTGRRVGVAAPGERFRRASRDRYEIDALSREACQTLLKDLAGSNRTPAVVLHCHSVGATSAADLSAVDYERDQRQAFATLVPLAQALGDA